MKQITQDERDTHDQSILPENSWSQLYRSQLQYISQIGALSVPQSEQIANPLRIYDRIDPIKSLSLKFNIIQLFYRTICFSYH